MSSYNSRLIGGMAILSLLFIPIDLVDAPVRSSRDGVKATGRWAAAKAETRSTQCTAKKSFVLGNSPDTILLQTLNSTILPQAAVPIEDLSALVAVPANGVLDLTLKLEAKHRGEGFSEVVGIGAYMTYQYAKTRAGLDTATVVRPLGWVGGTNIRDLRDHYGQINIVSALGVKPGHYRICLFATAHSTLTESNRIAEILVEGGGSPLNTLRLSYKPGGRLLD